MELLIAVGLLCALGLLAARWGVDSRELGYSKEQELARLGMTWRSQPLGHTEVLRLHQTEERRNGTAVRRNGHVGVPGRSMRRRTVRGRLARAFTALAVRLDPEVTQRSTARRLGLSPLR